MPEALGYLWGWLLDIHNTRTINGMGASRATQLDIWAWQQNTGNKLALWELGAVMDLGAAWLVEKDPKKANGDLPPAMRT